MIYWKNICAHVHKMHIGNQTAYCIILLGFEVENIVTLGTHAQGWGFPSPQETPMTWYEGALMSWSQVHSLHAETAKHTQNPEWKGMSPILIRHIYGQHGTIICTNLQYSNLQVSSDIWQTEMVA